MLMVNGVISFLLMIQLSLPIGCHSLNHLKNKTMFYPRKQSSKIKHKASDGTGYTENQIKAKLSEAYALRYNEQITYLCEDCGKNQATESSHIIAKARCKVIHRTELIWDKNNFYASCRECHERWHDNDQTLVRYWQLMEYMKENDLEGYLKRINL